VESAGGDRTEKRSQIAHDLPFYKVVREMAQKKLKGLGHASRELDGDIIGGDTGHCSMSRDNVKRRPCGAGGARKLID